MAALRVFHVLPFIVGRYLPVYWPAALGSSDGMPDTSEEKNSKRKLTFTDWLAAFDRYALAGVITQQVLLYESATVCSVFFLVPVDLGRRLSPQEFGHGNCGDLVG